MKVKINNKEIVEVEYYKGILKNFRGLMFSKKKNVLLTVPYESKSHAAIHSFFVFFPFYAIFLDSNKEVVDFKKMKPFQIYSPKKSAKYILELCENVRHIDKKVVFKL